MKGDGICREFMKKGGITVMEDEKEIIRRTEQMVKEKLESEGSGHDWWHIVRVVHNAQHISKTETVDAWVVTMGALLHDVIDDKVVVDPDLERANLESWLENQGVSQYHIDQILAIIDTISFKHGFEALPSLEAEVVQDADRLDAIGAVGIARCFTYSGSKGSPIHDPNLFPRESMTPDQYRRGDSSAINHFYEKLLTLKDKMNTEEGYRIACERHQFMEQYLQQFFAEWDGFA
ncbi:uncharacterized protein ABID56_002473 [Alkalibacillus flavidus]|uniref:HD/PDEase domain-containing protein n=1 Tax=Alkalibacillus flavidus TaxID=546021 RepID=A0ABV2KXN9_9BACI